MSVASRSACVCLRLWVCVVGGCVFLAHLGIVALCVVRLLLPRISVRIAAVVRLCVSERVARRVRTEENERNEGGGYS